MKKIISEIADRDKKMAKIIDHHFKQTSQICTIGSKPSQTTHFQSLVESVISQQLAVKAADTIFNRIYQAAGKKITPQSMAKLSDGDFRSAGVSGAKSKTIQGLASAALSKEIDFKKLDSYADEEIYSKLTSLWGIGPWTVDMFMIFQMGRLDIWPTGDLGVRRGWEKIYSLKEEITPRELEKKGEKFRPYRSVIAWYCWRALDVAKPN